MSEFTITGSDVFGKHCYIDQYRYHSKNERFIYKAIQSMRSNAWCEVPYKCGSREVLHNHMEDCVLVICCGVDETKVQRFRLADVEFVEEEAHEQTQHTHCCPCGAQRTCRLEGGYGDAGGKVGKVCSECKTTVEFHWREPPNFCPNCGAKVVL